MSVIRLKRLTGDQLQYWQLHASTKETRFPFFDGCNMYSRILRRSLEYYAIEVDFYEASQAGDKVAKEVCAMAREKMEWELSFVIWINYN